MVDSSLNDTELATELMTHMMAAYMGLFELGDHDAAIGGLMSAYTAGLFMKHPELMYKIYDAIFKHPDIPAPPVDEYETRMLLTNLETVLSTRQRVGMQDDNY